MINLTCSVCAPFCIQPKRRAILQRLQVGAFVLLLSSGFLGATEYFVSPSGNDAQAGFPREQAFATIQKGVNALKPGDTLTIRPGEYRESIRRDNLGSADAETLIRAEIPGTVLIRGDTDTPDFRKVEGKDYVYETDLPAGQEVNGINELDTLRVLDLMPNIEEVEAESGRYAYDKATGKLYISTTDRKPAPAHRYSASGADIWGLYLSKPTRVTLEGLAVTGFNTLKVIPHRARTAMSAWGIYLDLPKQCVVRDCRTYLNARGLGLDSGEEVQTAPGSAAGQNLVEGCESWANNSQFSFTDGGGISIYCSSRDTVQNSKSYLNGGYGINIYGGTSLADEKFKSVLRDNIAWGNYCDYKVKTGWSYFHQVIGSVGSGLWSVGHPKTSLIGRGGTGKENLGNILLDELEKLQPEKEFADPLNHDYHLQSTSQFRGQGPDGTDLGPFPFKPNIFYVKPDGSDADDGLAVTTAWKTLARATAALKPGDTLYLLPGRYAAGDKWQIAGTPEAPIAVRGRGIEPVVIEGPVALSQAGSVKFDRLAFLGKVSASESTALAFNNCSFSGTPVGLTLDRVNGLRVTQSQFTGFGEAAIAIADTPPGKSIVEKVTGLFSGPPKAAPPLTSSLFIAGNVFNNPQGPAIRVADLASILYSDRNGFANAAAWSVAGKTVTLAEAAPNFETYSQAIKPEFVAQGELGFSLLANSGAFAGMAPFGRPFGLYRDKLPIHTLELLRPPEVHSVSATTANIKWLTSQPATCQLAWGETEACEKKLSIDIRRFGTYSFTGLKPGQTYYFRLVSIATPEVLVEKLGAQKITPDAPVLSFTTSAQNKAPVTYFVAVDGKNTNSGLDRQNAFRTISHAAGVVNAGDTVEIAGGTYVERVRLYATGDEGAPITFRSLPGEKVVLDGANLQLNQAFISLQKSYLRFDGLYFQNFSFFPENRFRLLTAAEFQLVGGKDIKITRCFSDGRAGYTAFFVRASQIRNLTIQNCVMTNKMGGAIMIENCPGLSVTNTVFARPMIAAFVLRNNTNEIAKMDNNIFTDMMQKKAVQNFDMFMVDGELPGFSQNNNCYFVREFPPDKRILVAGKTYLQQPERIRNPLFVDPQFAGNVGRPTSELSPEYFASGRPGGEYSPEYFMNPEVPLDFNTFFATNQDVLSRGMGLQPEAFAGWNWQPLPPPKKSP